jgi:hypothetical protein
MTPKDDLKQWYNTANLCVKLVAPLLHSESFWTWKIDSLETEISVRGIYETQYKFYEKHPEEEKLFHALNESSKIIPNLHSCNHFIFSQYSSIKRPYPLILYGYQQYPTYKNKKQNFDRHLLFGKAMSFPKSIVPKKLIDNEIKIDDLIHNYEFHKGEPPQNDYSAIIDKINKLQKEFASFFGMPIKSGKLQKVRYFLPEKEAANKYEFIPYPFTRLLTDLTYYRVKNKE